MKMTYEVKKSTTQPKSISHQSKKPQQRQQAQQARGLFTH